MLRIFGVALVLLACGCGTTSPMTSSCSDATASKQCEIDVYARAGG